MARRKTARSQTFEYETSNCIHCDDEVFVDQEMDNIDNLPEGINVIVGGGKHMSADKTGVVARSKDYRTPKVLVKWFRRENSNKPVNKQYMCPSCAEAVYEFKK
ncbi:hypothetical protein ACLI4Q_05575 [Natrialbaceae archaeon A-CW1-1]